MTLHDFFDDLDFFEHEIENKVSAKKAELTTLILDYLASISPIPGLAPYATGEYLLSHVAHGGKGNLSPSVKTIPGVFSTMSKQNNAGPLEAYEQSTNKKLNPKSNSHRFGEKIKPETEISIWNHAEHALDVETGYKWKSTSGYFVYAKASEYLKTLDKDFA